MEFANIDRAQARYFDEAIGVFVHRIMLAACLFLFTRLFVSSRETERTLRISLSRSLL